MLAISYKGPSAIHSTINLEAQKRGLEYLSLWCHCPYYLQGTTHFGLLSHLGKLLSEWCGFNLDTEELSITWRELSKQIQSIIDKNPELQGMIQDVAHARAGGGIIAKVMAKKGWTVIGKPEIYPTGATNFSGD